MRISLESQAKLYIQSMIREGSIELASSFILSHENTRNPYDIRRRSIEAFLVDNVSVYVSARQSEEIRRLAEDVMQTGIKAADALHVACAIIAHCDFLLTTDMRLLKHRNDKIRIMNPVDFITILGGAENE